MYPVIRVRDTQTGREHIVGTDRHDCLYIDDGAMHYINTHCCAGTKFGEYEFVGIDTGEASVTMRPEVDMADLDELISMHMEVLDETVKNKLALFDLAKRQARRTLDNAMQESGIRSDLSGTVIESL